MEQANIDIQGRLEFGPSGTLQIELQEGSKFAPVSCGPANLGGTLECTGVHSEYPRAGDVIPLISVAGTQKLGWNERFDLALLPGLPDGLFTVVEGDGATGAALVESGVDKISFTGSVATGRRVGVACGRNLTPCTL